MRTHLVITAGALALASLATVSSTARAQSVARPAGVTIAPYAGYMLFGNYLDGPLGTSISSSAGPVVGAQLGINLAPGIALIGNVGYASGDLKVGIPLLGGVSVGNTSAWLYDGGVQLGVPLASGFSPFIQVGAGAIRHKISSGPLATTSTNFAGNVGLGADVALSRSVGLRLLAKDYIGKFDVKEATSLDVQSKVAHNVALGAGVTLRF
ncbi:MAG TPA: outer membrane beta-barrel protein [Gemmatimonadaceae bacterium]|nr:outer membrane beta-barrel protein [Gemmatimonadaceae bacterium]